MISLVDKGIETLKQADENANLKKFHKSHECYNRAVKFFANALTVKECVVFDLKNELKEQINFCINRVDELERLIAKDASLKTEMQNVPDDDIKLIERIKSTVVCRKPDVRFSDVCGLEKIKESLEAAVILPVQFPELYSKKRSPYKAFLLFGPPGTGKSFIAEACAGEALQSTFFSISASDLTSKYQGESENLVKNLFKVARLLKPSIIFIDEIDSMVLSRSDNDGDGSRRIKTELFVQMQGVSSNNSGVFLMAATNLPQNLDSAILRRFDKMIYIPLPDRKARSTMLKKLLLSDDESSDISLGDIEELSKITKGLSGSDINIFCRKANQLSIGRVQEATHFRKMFDEGSQKWLYKPCSSTDEGAINMKMRDVPSGCLSFSLTTTKEDALKCAKEAKPSFDTDQLKEVKTFAEEKGEWFENEEYTESLPETWSEVFYDIFCCGRC